MPFGMNIRKAAYKATFGSVGSHSVLARYTMMGSLKLRNQYSDYDLSSIADSDSSESVSLTSSVDDFGGATEIT